MAGRILLNKPLTLSLALLTSSVCLQARPTYSGANVGKTAEVEPDPAMLEGCLQKSEGEYTITDKDGLLHHLTEGPKLLKSYVGHEVQLTGTPSIRTIDTTPPGGASSAIEKPVFRVRTVKDVAATCQSLAR
jgi:hypothetical protein